MVAQALALIQANDYRRRVVLLELDLENPALAEQLRLAARPGLAELAQGSSAMSEVLQPFGPRLAAITAGASLPAAGAGIEAHYAQADPAERGGVGGQSAQPKRAIESDGAGVREEWVCWING